MKHWDVESGVGISLTHTRYDVQESLESRYFDVSCFADLSYTPTEKWNFQLSADLSRYSDLGIDQAIRIPLLRVELNYYFLAHNRGVLSLIGYDLLDRNQNIERLSELNFLRETRSNTLSRYIMLTFKYRLNKFAGAGGLEVDVHGRR